MRAAALVKEPPENELKTQRKERRAGITLLRNTTGKYYGEILRGNTTGKYCG